MKIFLWFPFALCVLFNSCTSKLVEASGYTEISLGPEVSLKLPAQFARIQPVKSAAQPNLTPQFIGDSAGDTSDQNFWAVTHAFAFRESKTAAGAAVIPALLLVSRLANLQSFSSAQVFYESATRFSTDPRWAKPQRLTWKSQQVSKSLTYLEAELIPGMQGASVFVMLDRDSLLQALLLGDRTVIAPEPAKRVLADLRTGYRLIQPLDDYFHNVSQAIHVNAELRRKHYLALLETLQREELDYTPTPRVVVFNANLAGQFCWPIFDRSGVPSHFAIAGRLGNLVNLEPKAWKQLETLFPGMHLSTASIDSDKWTFQSLSAKAPLPSRSLALLSDTGWLGMPDANARQAFATLEFPFTQDIPNLSEWLNILEAVQKQAESRKLISIPSLR